MALAPRLHFLVLSSDKWSGQLRRECGGEVNLLYRMPLIILLVLFSLSVFAEEPVDQTLHENDTGTDAGRQVLPLGDASAGSSAPAAGGQPSARTLENMLSACLPGRPGGGGAGESGGTPVSPGPELTKVKEVLLARCTGCHSGGQPPTINSSALDKKENLRKFLNAIQSGKMPKGDAAFKDSADGKAVIQALQTLTQ